MEAPEIDIEKLKKWKERNFQERLKFVDLYVEWLKKNKIKYAKDNK